MREVIHFTTPAFFKVFLMHKFCPKEEFHWLQLDLSSHNTLHANEMEINLEMDSVSCGVYLIKFTFIA